MTLGYEISKGALDSEAANAAIALRAAFEKIEIVQGWLSDRPIVDSVDPLTATPFGYTADEAYALRNYFSTFDAVRIANTAAFNSGRLMTGLE